MNQDLRRFSGYIPIIFEELNIFSRVRHREITTRKEQSIIEMEQNTN